MIEKITPQLINDIIKEGTDTVDIYNKLLKRVMAKQSEMIDVLNSLKYDGISGRDGVALGTKAINSLTNKS